MMRRRLALLSTALLAGCASLGPHFERPAAPVATTVPDAPATPSARPAADIEWLRFFVDQRLM
jgi:multidrug efflux system outer membrane protein